MKFIADLHLHSKYSRAVSAQMILPEMARWAKLKGIDLIATADFTHPLWFRGLQSGLAETGNGLYQLKEELKSQSREAGGKNGETDPHFILSTELSCIYSQGGQGRRIHLVVLMPSLEAVAKLNEQLRQKGVKLMADGRPTLGMSAQEITRLILEINEGCLVIPAHVWTPWYSLYGSRSGFDSIEECFGDLAGKITAVETGLSCYDKETEVLTNNGWKQISEVYYSDEICTLNLETDELEYQKPKKIFSYQYKGKMYRLKTKRVDLLVTPNHNLLVSSCDFRKPPVFSLKEVGILFNKSKRFKKDGIWKGKNKEYFILPAVETRHGNRYYSGSRHQKEKKLAMKSWLKFFGFWLAEGWITRGKDGDYNIGLANRNSKVLTEMRQILESFGYNAYQGKNLIRVRDYQLFCYLKQFGKSSDKFVPQEIKALAKDLLEILLKYYIYGDGHVYGRTKKGISATTSSIRLRDDLQEIALKIGMSAYYKLHRRKGSLISSLPYKKKIYKMRQNSWTVYFIRKNKHIVLPSTIKKYNYIESWVKFDGPVFCVSVPNQVVYVRRNGIPVWCGNSDPAMNWRIAELANRVIVSFSDAHSPEKFGREATIFEGELSYQGVVQALKGEGKEKNAKTKIAGTIEFYPEEGKYHYTGHRDCEIRHSPQDSARLGTTCPVCGRPLTIGVMHRVEKLASKDPLDKQIQESEVGVRWVKHPQGKHPPYMMLVPLMEIIAEARGRGVNTQGVKNDYLALVKHIGSEFEVLIKASYEDLAKVAEEKVVEGIKRVRQGNLTIDPGFDGGFGKVKLFGEKEKSAVSETGGQLELFG